MNLSRLTCTLALVVACDSEPTDQDTAPVAHGLADWSECVDYPTGDVTCDEVCADEGKLCAVRACDGYTALRFTMPECSNMHDAKDYDCGEVFDVTTSSYTSAQCCCW